MGLNRCVNRKSSSVPKIGHHGSKKRAVYLLKFGRPSLVMIIVIINVLRRHDMLCIFTSSFQTDKEQTKGHVILPYVKGLSERISKSMRSQGITTSFRPQNTIRNILVHPKDKIASDCTCGVGYQVDCLNCEKVYIGETGRKLSTRIVEHQKDYEKSSQGN